MTTKVTVHANGSNYPARILKFENGNETAIEDIMVGSGFAYETWVGSNQTLVVTEEYHPAGYPAPPANAPAIAG